MWMGHVFCVSFCFDSEGAWRERKAADMCILNQLCYIYERERKEGRKEGKPLAACFCLSPLPTYPLYPCFSPFEPCFIVFLPSCMCPFSCHAMLSSFSVSVPFSSILLLPPPPIILTLPYALCIIFGWDWRSGWDLDRHGGGGTTWTYLPPTCMPLSHTPLCCPYSVLLFVLICSSVRSILCAFFQLNVETSCSSILLL